MYKSTPISYDESSIAICLLFPQFFVIVQKCILKYYSFFFIQHILLYALKKCRMCSFLFLRAKLSVFFFFFFVFHICCLSHPYTSICASFHTSLFASFFSQLSSTGDCHLFNVMFKRYNKQQSISSVRNVHTKWRMR